MAHPPQRILSPPPHGHFVDDLDNKTPAQPDEEEEPTLDMDTMKEVGLEVPSHPIPAMQAAFAESMMETSESSASRPHSRDAAARRRNLLDQPVTQETHAARWRQKPGQQYHQLWKLMAQISFGIYLLLNGIAKDDEQVMAILQGHVDEVDEFLESTLEDFDLALQDIEERLKLLKLPLERVEVFDAMLQDRGFRLQIINGNEKIEHVITRTATAMNDALKDVKQGVSACKEFINYLQEEQDEVWREERPEMEKVFEAMQGNVDGWYKAYVSLQTKGNKLGVALVQLGSIVVEIDRRAGEVSRKTRFSTTPQSSPTSSSPVASPPRPSQHLRQSMLKTLPSDPSMITPAISATLPAFQLVEDRERTPEPTDPKSDVAKESVSGTYLNLDDSDDEDGKATQYILAPRTYTPVPSPRQASTPFQEHTPLSDENKKLPTSKRFSLIRGQSSPEVVQHQNYNDGYWGPREPVFSVSEAEHIRDNSAGANGERGTGPITVPTPHELEAIASPPSQGIDSSYFSDPEKAFPPPFDAHPALVSNSRTGSPHMHSSGRLATPPVLREAGPPSSRSEPHHYFLPVNASSHATLQRPWTAAPSSYPTHDNARLSNHSNGSNSSNTRFQSPSPRPSHLRNLPSAMGESTMTSMTDGGTKKKKKSPFGWFKKAFSLSEEEKAAFEERKRRAHYEDGYYEERPQPKWIDGKRIR